MTIISLTMNLECKPMVIPQGVGFVGHTTHVSKHRCLYSVVVMIPRLMLYNTRFAPVYYWPTADVSPPHVRFHIHTHSVSFIQQTHGIRRVPH